MSLQDFAGGTPEKNFEDALLNLSPGTRRLYRRCFNKFCNWLDTTPNKLFEEALQYERTAPWTLGRAVSTFMNDLIEEGKHPNTVKSYKKAVNKFLKSNGLKPVRIENEKKIDYKGMSIIKPEEIRELATYTEKNLRLRALIMILKDSGLRVSDIVKLTIEDWRNNTRRFRDNHGREYIAWMEPITTQKSGVNAYIHLGPESVEWIDKYIGNRRKGPIFVKKNGEPLKPHTVTTLMNNLCKPLRERGVKVSAHSFRKFFVSSFASNGYLEAGNRIAGKRVHAADDPYLDFERTLDDIYIEVYNSERAPLSIYERSQIAETQEEIEKIRAEMAQMREEKAHAEEIGRMAIERMSDEDRKKLENEILVAVLTKIKTLGVEFQEFENRAKHGYILKKEEQET